MKRIKAAVLASIALTLFALATPAAAEPQKYRATFVEIGGDTGTGSSCGTGTLSGFGHVANQCIEFDACGINCHERTIVFDDGSVLVVEESVVGVITHGNSTGFLEITQTIAGGSGRFEGATGSGTGVVNLNSGAVIIATGTITLADDDN
jgi:hypothetical protein